MGVASRQQIGIVMTTPIFYQRFVARQYAGFGDRSIWAGTPVVTTSPESMPYLVENERTGLLSAVGDEKTLAANVIRLLRDPELAARLHRMLTKNRANVRGTRCAAVAQRLSRILNH